MKPEPKHDWVVQGMEGNKNWWGMVLHETESNMRKRFPDRTYRQLVSVLEEEY